VTDVDVLSWWLLIMWALALTSSVLQTRRTRRVQRRLDYAMGTLKAFYMEHPDGPASLKAKRR
jgi:hypothetical protein